MSKCLDLGLPNDHDSFTKYVEFIVNSGIAREIYIQGSRSPLRSRQPHAQSDYDMHVITNTDIRLVNPRITRQLCADVHFTTDGKGMHSKAVMIYPRDEYGVLK